jgi:hypothetical protein
MVSGEKDMATSFMTFFPVGNGATADRGTSGRQNDLAIHLDHCSKGDEENQRPTNLSSSRTGQDWPALLQELTAEVASVLAIIFCTSLATGDVPFDWHAATTAPTIFKRVQN